LGNCFGNHTECCIGTRNMCNSLDWHYFPECLQIDQKRYENAESKTSSTSLIHSIGNDRGNGDSFQGFTIYCAQSSDSVYDYVSYSAYTSIDDCYNFCKDNLIELLSEYELCNFYCLSRQENIAHTRSVAAILFGLY